MNKWMFWSLLALFFVVGIFCSSYMLLMGHVYFAAGILGFLAISTFVFVKKGAHPLRFMYPGLVTFFLFLVLPIIFTVVIGFTNLSTGHLLSKDSATKLLLEDTYVATDGTEKYLTYSLRHIRDTNYDLYAYDELSDKNFFANFDLSNSKIVSLVESTAVVPKDILSKGEVFRVFKLLKKKSARLEHGTELTFHRINQLVNIKMRFSLGEDGSLIDNRDGKVFTPDQSVGAYRNGDNILSPGYYVYIGFGNFLKLFTDKSVKESFLKIFLWTMIWALGSVFLSFSLGISLALLVNSKSLKGKAIYRVLLIIPYSIPFFISILVFRGLLNKDFGIINEIFVAWGIPKVNWLGDPIVAKLSCLLVNLWLGFPYMFLVTTGILQSIPESVYEAASIDGAKRWAKFRHITLPMTFSAVAPLLVGSFAFNLNNFVGIYLLTGGGPPIPGATTPAGETDILISYTYRLAFEGGGGQDFGLASSIAIIIFFIISVITLFNFKVSGMFKNSDTN
ncbi:MAG: maltose ABC transporter permease MalF [Bacteriovoracaceae bacterium]|nr:maltose ABC transporter permease MalF [Bacteriovoracaceae bacterium]